MKMFPLGLLHLASKCKCKKLLHPMRILGILMACSKISRVTWLSVTVKSAFLFSVICVVLCNIHLIPYVACFTVYAYYVNFGMYNVRGQGCRLMQFYFHNEEKEKRYHFKSSQEQCQALKAILNSSQTM